MIFGSYARGNETKASDIDLMVICENGRDVDIQRIISLFPLDIHLVSLNFEEFNSMAKTKEFNVVGEALVNNIILIGIEDYYRMLENVG
ncbi:MAG: nucleotidyltransferase domain-containing protein [Methanobacterium sp.]